MDTLKPISLPAPGADDADFTKALMASFMETGFAVIANHGLDQSKIDEAYQASRDFFALPAETKQTYFDPNGAGQRGYTPFGQENAKGVAAIDLKEFWHTGRELPEDHPYRETMPDTPSVPEVPDFDAATNGIFKEFDALGHRLLQSVATLASMPFPPPVPSRGLGRCDKPNASRALSKGEASGLTMPCLPLT